MALTQSYVTPTGSGAQNGTSWADSYALSDISGGVFGGTNEVFNFAGGAYTYPAAPLTWGFGNTGGAVAAYVGWNAARTAVATSWDDCPVFNCNSQDINASAAYDYVLFHGMKFTSAAAGIHFDNGNVMSLVWVDGATGLGIQLDNINTFLQCRASNCGSTGLFGLTDNNFVLCEAYGNGEKGIQTQSQLVATLCYTRGNTTGGISLGTSTVASNIAHCTIDNEAIGVEYANSGTYWQVLYGNNITNCTTGVDGGGTLPVHLLQNNNFSGNTANYANMGDIFVDSGETALDPTYGGVASNDYSIAQAALKQVATAIGPVQAQALNIGAHQYIDTSGGGGGGGVGTDIPATGRITVP